jgi:hypothetical protein
MEEKGLCFLKIVLKSKNDIITALKLTVRTVFKMAVDML